MEEKKPVKFFDKEYETFILEKIAGTVGKAYMKISNESGTFSCVCELSDDDCKRVFSEESRVKYLGFISDENQVALFKKV